MGEAKPHIIQLHPRIRSLPVDSGLSGPLLYPVQGLTGIQVFFPTADKKDVMPGSRPGKGTFLGGTLTPDARGWWGGGRQFDRDRIAFADFAAGQDDPMIPPEGSGCRRRAHRVAASARAAVVELAAGVAQPGNLDDRTSREMEVASRWQDTEQVKLRVVTFSPIRPGPTFEHRHFSRNSSNRSE